MEEIKVTRDIVTYAQFTWAQGDTGYQTGGSKVVEDRNPQTLELDPRVCHFIYGDVYFLTDEQGIEYVPNNSKYYNVSPTIYVGTAIPIDEALEMYKSNSGLYPFVEAAKKDGCTRICKSNGGFIEGMDANGLTLEEYTNQYEQEKLKTM